MSWNNGMTEISCVVVRIVHETPSCVSIYVRPANSEQLSHFSAGQYVELQFEIDGQRVRRCYSLSSSAYELGSYRLTIQRVEKGIVSNWLCTHAHVGMLLTLSQPQGQFVLPNINGCRKLLLMAAGSGITPFISMLYTLRRESPDCDLVLLISVKRQQDLIANEEVRALITQLSKARLVITCTEEVDQQGVCSGRWNGQRVLDICPDLLEREIMLCGSSGFISDIRNEMSKVGVATQRVHSEAFSANIIRSVVDSTKRTIQVKLLPEDVSWQTDGTQTLLAVAESHGDEIPSVCRSGLCGACAVSVQGKSHSEGRDALDDASYDAGVRLACMTYPRGDCIIKLS
ncbi:2Fe-2S iron-sulfur cluster-binding protein [Pseudoalteromonas xiamenensis]